MVQRDNAIITDRGLSQRLGQTITLRRCDKRDVKGTLVFYPRGFAVVLEGRKKVSTSNQEIVLDSDAGQFLQPTSPVISTTPISEVNQF